MILNENMNKKIFWFGKNCWNRSTKRKYKQNDWNL